jgi:hypothetical protein
MPHVTGDHLWPNKRAIVVSEENHLYLLIRELVRSNGWKIEMPPCSPRAAIDLVNNGNAECIIVIESATSPMNETLRILLKDPRVRLTPILAMIQPENQGEHQVYEKIFKVGVAVKPLRPNNFIPAYKRLIRSWEQPVMIALRRTAYASEKEALEKRMGILNRLCFDEKSLPYALSALLQMMLAAGHYKEAGKKVLKTFQDHHTNPAVLAICAWFYLSARVPQLALRYLTKLRSVVPSSSAFNFDIASTHLACGQVTDALNVMREWHDKHPGNSTVESFLARLIVADGQQDTIEIVRLPNNIIRKVSDYWDKLEKALTQDSASQKPGIKAS